MDPLAAGIVAKAQAVLQQHPEIRSILMECTELPPFSDAVRFATGLPVFDAITCCDFFMSGCMDNKRFGLNKWQEERGGFWKSTTEVFLCVRPRPQAQAQAVEVQVESRGAKDFTDEWL